LNRYSLGLGRFCEKCKDGRLIEVDDYDNFTGFFIQCNSCGEEAD